VIVRLRRAGSWLYRVSDRLLIGLFAVGVLSTPFYRTAYLRAHLLGAAAVPATAGVAVLCLGLCLAWRSLLRRDFVWLAPARLTWADADGARVGQVGRRLWGGWAVRFLAVAYVAAVGVALFTGSGWLPAGYPVFGAVAVCSVVLARRRPGTLTGWWGALVAVGLAAVAGWAAFGTVRPVVLWVLAGLVVLAALGLAVGSGALRRPAVAVGAGRDELVRGYFERLVRRVSVSFGDALALLPAPRPVPWPWLLDGPGVVARFAVAGVVARARSLVLSVLLAVVVAVAHRVLPQVSSVWLIGIGAYFAAVPVGASLAQLCGVPALRRWLGCTDLQLRVVTAGAVVAVAGVWFGLVVALGVPAAGMAVVVAVGAVVRTVTRPALDYGNVGVAATPDGNLVPVGLLRQLVHGPDLLVVGLLLVGVGSSAGPVGLLVLGLAGYGVLR
jgi:hypothetical protein